MALYVILPLILLFSSWGGKPMAAVVLHGLQTLYYELENIVTSKDVHCSFFIVAKIWSDLKLSTIEQ